MKFPLKDICLFFQHQSPPSLCSGYKLCKILFRSLFVLLGQSKGERFSGSQKTIGFFSLLKITSVVIARWHKLLLHKNTNLLSLIKKLQKNCFQDHGISLFVLLSYKRTNKFYLFVQNFSEFLFRICIRIEQSNSISILSSLFRLYYN